jgi:hypothetical protein
MRSFPAALEATLAAAGKRPVVPLIGLGGSLTAWLPNMDWFGRAARSGRLRWCYPGPGRRRSDDIPLARWLLTAPVLMHITSAACLPDRPM